MLSGLREGLRRSLPHHAARSRHSTDSIPLRERGSPNSSSSSSASSGATSDTDVNEDEYQSADEAELEENPDVDIGPEEISRQLSQIGGWWGVVANRFIVACETPAHALSEIKTALLQDTISYGVVSAVMLTIAQAEMTLEDSDEAQVPWRVMKQVHANCWYLCFAANMLCLYLSTTEYLYTVATHPKDILLLLSKRYPPGFGKLPQCTFDSWMQFLKVGKLDAFKRGFQTMVPGLLSGVYLRCDWNITVGPIVITMLTCLLGWAMWKDEMRPKPKPVRPAKAGARASEPEARLEPWRNSRELFLTQGARGPSDAKYAPLPEQDDSAFRGSVSALANCAIGPFAASSSGSIGTEEFSQRSDQPQRRTPEKKQGESRNARPGRSEEVREDQGGGGGRRGSSDRRRGDSGSHRSRSSSDRDRDRGRERGYGAAPRIEPPPEPRYPQRGSARAKRRSADSASPKEERRSVHFDFD